jgi:hypothetical protein
VLAPLQISDVTQRQLRRANTTQKKQFLALLNGPITAHRCAYACIKSVETIAFTFNLKEVDFGIHMFHLTSKGQKHLLKFN